MAELDEMRELIADALEQVKFCRESGVTGFAVDGAQSVEARLAQADPTSSPTPPPIDRLEADDRPVTAPVLFTAPSVSANSLTSTPAETLNDIKKDLGDCQRCKLWSTRTNLVFGEGDPSAKLMFVGEGPGADEDLSGRPFVGRAGQLLTKMIEAIGLSREQVYIANVVKSRPPENRTPERDEVEACLPFLLRQIAVIRPRLIVTLGNPATQALLVTNVGITRLRGKFHDFPQLPNIQIMPTYHPAYLLRSPDKKRETWEDLKMVRDRLQFLSS
ncbi:MAG: uracil-DNA glycosylase [Acidobacteria bacterium]|nr:uracil-DNA glycosylase [Acidobacteriota bacterium]